MRQGYKVSLVRCGDIEDEDESSIVQVLVQVLICFDRSE